jgi:ACR3 family arsenite efflux pump ArsB
LPVPVIVQILQSLVVVAIAPLYAGVMARAEAVVESKRGPSVRDFLPQLDTLVTKGLIVLDPVEAVRVSAAQSPPPARRRGR